MQFKDIVGQRDVINRLTEIIDSGRVSHAQLLLGPTAGGSLQMALAYLQYLCCEHRQHGTENGERRTENEADASAGSPLSTLHSPLPLRADSCGVCPSCKKIASLMHPDLHLVFPNATTARVKSNPSSAEFGQEFREFILEHNALGTLDEWLASLNIENKQGAINVRDADLVDSALGLKSYEGGWKMVVIWMAEKMNTECANKLLKTLEEPQPGTIIMLVAESDERLLSTIRSRVQTVRLRGSETLTLHSPLSTLQSTYAPMLVAWLRLLFKLKMKELSAQVDTMAGLGREQLKLFLQYSLDVMRGCFLNTMAGLPYNIGSGDEKFDRQFPQMVTQNNIELISDALGEAIFAIERNAFAKTALMELSFRMSKALKKK